MTTYTINKVTYTVRSKGLEEACVGRRPLSRIIPFTSMLMVEYFPGEHIKITLIDKAVVYITVEEENTRDHANLFALYSTLLL